MYKLENVDNTPKKPFFEEQMLNLVAPETKKQAERRADCGEPINPPINNKAYRFRALIDLHIADMKDVRKPLRRSKAYSLKTLRQQLGKLPLEQMTRKRIIEFGRGRAKDGAGPATLAADICYIGAVRRAR